MRAAPALEGRPGGLGAIPGSTALAPQARCNPATPNPPACPLPLAVPHGIAWDTPSVPQDARSLVPASTDAPRACRGP
jgi:hypothetical protein